MAGLRIISSDNHIFEPPDLWLDRIEPKFKDRAPRIVREGDEDWWHCDGKRVQGTGIGFGGAQPGRRFEDVATLTVADVFENVRPGGYIPEEQIKDMDIDGIDVSILYPTAGLQLFKEPDSELLTAIFSTYNDWLAEFCRTSPKRLKGIAMINLDDVQVGVRELERCKKLGFIGAMITSYPPEGRRYNQPEYEPVWAAAQDLDMPLSLHLATNRLGCGEADWTRPDDLRPAMITNVDHHVRMSLADMIYSGVFEEYPKLQVGAVEFALSWAPHFIDRMDYDYTQRSQELTHRFMDNMLPSDFFHRNVFVGFQDDALGLRLRDIIGVDNMMWGSDYPHQESTFPKSREIIDEVLADCTEEEKAKIVGGNAARVYKI